MKGTRIPIALQLASPGCHDILSGYLNSWTRKRGAFARKPCSARPPRTVLSGSACDRSIDTAVTESLKCEVDCDALLERTRLASTAEACAPCQPEITRALEAVTAPFERARLLLCRARVRSVLGLARESCADAIEAMTLFEMTGDPELALDATSLATAHASRLGIDSLASELAAKSILGLGSVDDDWLRMDVTNRLGVFCYYYLDYDRAVEQFELSLAAAERIGDPEKVCRELANLTNALLRDSQQKEMSQLESNIDRLERAEVTARRLVREELALGNPQLSSSRLLAEVLCGLGQVDQALQVLEEFQAGATATTSAPQRAELAWVEARCLRLSGRIDEALAVARRDVRSVEASDDEHALMLAREELAACEQAAGDLEGALADFREVRRHIWAIHQRQTSQLVQQVWGRVDLERDRGQLQTKAADATRSAEEDALTGVGNRRLLERFFREEVGQQAAVACIIADVDSFKEINDTFGHRVGDAVLRQVGQLFLRETRRGQVAVRYGGGVCDGAAGRQPGDRAKIR